MIFNFNLMKLFYTKKSQNFKDRTKKYFLIMLIFFLISFPLKCILPNFALIFDFEQASSIEFNIVFQILKNLFR